MRQRQLLGLGLGALLLVGCGGHQGVESRARATTSSATTVAFATTTSITTTSTTATAASATTVPATTVAPTTVPAPDITVDVTSAEDGLADLDALLDDLDASLRSAEDALSSEG